MTRRRRTSPTPPESGPTRRPTSSNGPTEPYWPSRRSSRWPSSARTSTATGRRRSAATRSARARAITPSTPRRCTARPRYANRAYGHARRDAQGRLWLQYWLFYYYNDFQLLGPLLSGGKHEGDWELVQLRLNAAEQPDQVVYSQHTHSESKAWKDVKKAGNARRWSTSRAARTRTTSAPAHTGRACGGTAPTARARRSPPRSRSSRTPRRGCCGQAAGATPRPRARRSTP